MNKINTIKIEKAEDNGILLSVIVAIYNTEKELPQCIESIINQSYKNMEIILVDDGSTDGSSRICDEYAEKYENIIVIHKENKGGADVRNVGVNYSNGKYLGFVDGDDWIDDTMFYEMVALIEKYEGDIIVCGYNSVDEEGRVTSFCNDEQINFLNQKQAIEQILEDKWIQNFAWNKVYRRQLWDDSIIQKNLLGDFISTGVTFLKANKIIVYNKPLYNYRQRKGSAMHPLTKEKQIKYGYSLFLTYEYRMGIIEKKYSEYRQMMLRQMAAQGVSLYKSMLLSEYSGCEREELMDKLCYYQKKLAFSKEKWRVMLLQTGKWYEKLYVKIRKYRDSKI